MGRWCCCGEAGIGKSCVQVLKEHITSEPHTRIEWRGSSSHQQSALYPVIDHLHRLLRGTTMHRQPSNCAYWKPR